VIVTMTAGLTKIFSSDPKLGFLSHAALIKQQIASGTLPANIKSIEAAQRMIFNDNLDAGVAAFFLVSVVVILGASIKEWIAVTGGSKAAATSEAPYVRTQLTGA
jgi:carbon starvation protein